MGKKKKERQDREFEDASRGMFGGVQVVTPAPPDVADLARYNRGNCLDRAIQLASFRAHGVASGDDLSSDKVLEDARKFYGYIYGDSPQA